MAISEQEKMELYGQVIGAWMQKEKTDKLERFRRLNTFAKKGQILFAGSSLMEQFPIYEFLMDFDLPYTVYNRGIGGYTTQELLDSMKECIYDLEPSLIFLNIGTNDLNSKEYTLAGMLEKYEVIVRGIRDRLPDAKLFLLAYYPVNPNAADNPYTAEMFRYRTNERIREANTGVQTLAERYGAGYLDLNAGITDGEGKLRAEYTVEGVHMYADGYERVLRSLTPVLHELAALENRQHYQQEGKA